MPFSMSKTMVPRPELCLSSSAVGKTSVNFVKRATLAKPSFSVSGTNLIRPVTCSSRFYLHKAEPWIALNISIKLFPSFLQLFVSGREGVTQSLP